MQIFKNIFDLVCLVRQTVAKLEKEPNSFEFLSKKCN